MVLRDWTNALFKQHNSDLVLCWEQSTSIPLSSTKMAEQFMFFVRFLHKKTPLLDEGSRTFNTCILHAYFTSQVWPDGARYKGQWVRVAQLIL